MNFAFLCDPHPTFRHSLTRFCSCALPGPFSFIHPALPLFLTPGRNFFELVDNVPTSCFRRPGSAKVFLFLPGRLGGLFFPTKGFRPFAVSWSRLLSSFWPAVGAVPSVHPGSLPFSLISDMFSFLPLVGIRCPFLFPSRGPAQFVLGLPLFLTGFLQNWNVPPSGMDLPGCFFQK